MEIVVRYNFTDLSWMPIKTLVRLGQEVCQSPEEFKAWSQNLGHEQVLTTFLNYVSGL